MPMQKQQAPEIKKQNEALCEKYNIQGFPTVLILDGKGKQLGQLGYQAGGPAVFTAAYAEQVHAGK
jgi:protein disulfide-isomerase